MMTTEFKGNTFDR